MSNSKAQRSWVLAACLALAAGCHSSPKDHAAPGAETPPKVAEVTVSDVERFVKDKSAAIFDANDNDTRKEYGVVPGAVLLAGHSQYPLSVLPPTKTDKLVFYCGGTQCRASDKAAARAASAGYSDVNVMRAGVRGWKEAGRATTPAPQS